MPLSKKQDKERKKRQRSLMVKAVMPVADVRAMRRAGLNPDEFEKETGKISARLFYALMRDRDAINAHLSWHHEAAANPFIPTILERLQSQVKGLQEQMSQLQARVTLLEAEQVVLVTE